MDSSMDEGTAEAPMTGPGADAELAERVRAALERIRTATREAGDESGEGKLARRVRRLSRANQALEQELAELKAQRERDLAELDALVAELKPLIGEED